MVVENCQRIRAGFLISLIVTPVLTFDELIGIVRELHQLSAECAAIPEFFCDLVSPDPDSDPRDPNNCAECARSYGPDYTGPCEH